MSRGCYGTRMEDWEKYRKDNQSGESLSVVFKLKPHQKAALDELGTLMGEGMNRSDAIRFMVLPYLDAFDKAKKGKYWEGAITMSRGYRELGKRLKAQSMEKAQTTINFEEAKA